MVGEGVGAEGFEVALLLAVEEGAVEAEVGGFGGVDEAGAVVGAHLEDDAHFKLGEGFAAEATGDVVVAVERGEQVQSEGGAFGDEGVEHGAGFRASVVVAAAEGEVHVVLVPEFFEFVQAVDEDENRWGVGGAFGAAALEFVVNFGHDGLHFMSAGDGDAVGDAGEEVLQKEGVGGAGGGAVEEVEFGAGLRGLGGEGDQGQAEHGGDGFLALADDEEVVAALAEEGGLGGAFDGVRGTEPCDRGGGGLSGAGP